MTPEELNKALLVERFTPGPRRTRTTEVHIEETPVPDDSDVATARRRRELGEATGRDKNRRVA